jgi:hypothetical protein
MKLFDVICLVFIAACILSIAGCKDNSEPLPVIAAPAVLRIWTPQEECALAQALAPYPPDSVLWTLHDDWARMRREIGVKPMKRNTNCRVTTTELRLIS